MRLISKLKTDYKQYGFWGFCKRIAKFFLRKVGVQLDSYYYMVNQIDYKSRYSQFKLSGISDVKTLSYNDFLLGDKDVFTERKLEIIQKRSENRDYYPYGIIKDNRLVYSCWVSLTEIEFPNSLSKDFLLPEEALLVDDYCSPSERGKGIHTAMNSYRLCRIFELGKKQAVVIILKENIPAYKSQRKVGFETAFTYCVFTVLGKTFTDYYSKKRKYYGNKK